jgi:hypothetical protein
VPSATIVYEVRPWISATSPRIRTLDSSSALGEERPEALRVAALVGPVVIEVQRFENRQILGRVTVVVHSCAPLPPTMSSTT